MCSKTPTLHPHVTPTLVFSLTLAWLDRVGTKELHLIDVPLELLLMLLDLLNRNNTHTFSQHVLWHEHGESTRSTKNTNNGSVLLKWLPKDAAASVSNRKLDAEAAACDATEMIFFYFIIYTWAHRAVTKGNWGCGRIVKYCQNSKKNCLADIAELVECQGKALQCYLYYYLTVYRPNMKVMLLY